MVYTFLAGMVLLLGTAFLVGCLFRILNLPSVLAFLLTGLIIGPSGLGAFKSDDVDAFAQLGLILLLFNAGLGLSLQSLLAAGVRLGFATGLQMLGTAAVAGLFLLLLTPLTPLPAFLLGVAIAPSSTAILVKHLSDRGEQDTTTGMTATSVSVLQDVGILVFLVLLPIVGVGAGDELTTALTRTALGLVALVAVMWLGRTLLPWILRCVIAPAGPGMLVLFAVLMACGGAWLAGLAGWSLALGAFIAGLLLTSADARHQIAADVLPFRDIFNAFFFVSLGMLLDVGQVLPHLAVVLLAIVGLLLLKALVAAAAIRTAGWPSAVAINAGIGLCTVSEFGYVFGMEAAAANLFPQATFQILVAVIIGSMMGGTLFLPLAGRVLTLLSRWIVLESPATNQDAEQMKDHTLVVGYGTQGHNLTQVLRAMGLSYVVIEQDEEFAVRAREEGAPLVMGDATRLPILYRGGLRHARALAVTAGDAGTTARVVAQARSERPDLFILARATFVERLEDLKSAGADVIVAEDYEASIEIIAHVFKELGLPDHLIEAQVLAMRSGQYTMLRGRATDRVALTEFLRALELSVVHTFYLGAESPGCGHSLAELHLRARTGVTVLAVVREGHATANPPASWRLHAGDTLVLLGAHAQLAKARDLLQGEGQDEASGDRPDDAV